jgi:hypothetical protein
VRIRLQDESGHSAAQLSHNTVRNLVQRIGLYEIPRERPVADDWIWMIDHTIQAGTRKCFVVMGIRQADFLKRDRPLEHRDRGIDREISWGTSALALPERVRAGEVTAEQQADLPQPILEEELGWLDESAPDPARWQELNEICQQTCAIGRRFGYGRGLPERLRALPEGNSDDARSLVKQIQDFGAETAAATGSRDRVPGSSEVIESVIGKGKQLAGASGSRGLASQIPAMAAAVAQTTREYINDALTKTSIEQLRAWSRTFLPTSLESKRQRDLKPATAEQNLRKPIPATTPNF